MSLDGGGGFTGIGGGWLILIQGFKLTPYFLHPTLHLCLLTMTPFRLLNLFFSRSFISYVRPVTWSGRQSTWRPKPSRKLSLQWWGQRLRTSTTSYRWPGPSQSPLYLLAHPCLRGIGMHQQQLSQGQQLKATASEPLTQEHEATALDLRIHKFEEAHWKREACLACPLHHWGQCVHWDGTYVYQHKWHPVGLSLLGQGVCWGTLNLLCCYLCPCALHSSGHKIVMHFLSHHLP